MSSTSNHALPPSTLVSVMVVQCFREQERQAILAPAAFRRAMVWQLLPLHALDEEVVPLPCDGDAPIGPAVSLK